MNISTFVPASTRLRPDPAKTIEKGLELGQDPVQQDLFAVSTAISGVKNAAEFSDLGKARGTDSWQKGAYAIAASLTGSAATGLSLLQSVEELFADPVARGFFGVAGGLAGASDLNHLKDVTTGFGATPLENGLLGVAAAVAGPEGASEAIHVGLNEGQNSREGSQFALATAVAGGAQGVGIALQVARDFASVPELAGPYAVAASLAGREDAVSVLRMAEDMGQNNSEKALFSLVGALVGVERAPGFVRMSRAMAPTEGQIPRLAVAAALTGSQASAKEAAVAAALSLGLES